MTQSAFKTAPTKETVHFDRQDWASAYCNVEKELSDLELQASQGQIPKELCGTLFRNGPGRLERAGQWVHHPFDGDGMIASMHFQNGKASFSNRFVRTEAWKAEEAAGKFLYRGVFGTQKPGGAIANAFDLRLKNIANTHVIQLGDQLLALWEASSPHALNPKSLETHGLSNLNGVLKKGEAFSAHPRFDPGHHGEPRMVTFGVKTGPKSTIRVMEFGTKGDQAGKLISDRKDNFNGFAFLHDFAITPNWTLFLQNAIEFKPLPYILGKKGAAQCLSSKAHSKAKFWLVPRECGNFAGQAPRIIDAPNGFVFHHLNAWEKDKEIILESIFYKDFPSISPNEDFREINFDLIPEGILTRCHINLSNNEVTKTRLSEQCCEFGMVNPRLQGRNARYGWMAIAECKTGNGPLQGIKKHDLITNEQIIWSAAPRGFVSEPVMIPKATSHIEDEGWVLVLTWNSERKATDLVILNAKSLKQEALINLPIAIPHGLHGSWVPTS